MTSWIGAIAAAAALLACGGGGSDAAPGASRASVPGDVAPVAIAADPLRIEAAARPAVSAPTEERAEPAGPPLALRGYALLILRNGLVYSDGDELAAVHGAPYPVLRAVIHERVPSRGGARTLGVKPSCASDVRCEFVPPRGAGVPERFVLRLADDAVAHLSVRDDAVVVTATRVEFPQGTVVRLFFEPAGEPPAVREIVYGPRADPDRARAAHGGSYQAARDIVGFRPSEPAAPLSLTPLMRR